MLKGAHLTVLMGPTVPVPLPRPLVEALTSVQVTVASGRASGFQMSFTLSKKSLANTALIPAGFFDPKTRVIIVMTFKGTPHVLMDGMITNQEVSPDNAAGGATLNVTGSDLTVLMDMEEVYRCYPSMPPAARVELILARYARYGLIPLVFPTPLPEKPDPTDRVPVQTTTDLGYIKKLEHDNGYTFYLDPGPIPGVNVAYFGPVIRLGEVQPALNVNMDAHTNVESLNFSFDGLSRKQLTIVIQEPLTKTDISIPVPDISLLRPPLAARQAPSLRIERLEGSAKLSMTKATAIGLSKASQSSEAITANGQLDVMRYGRILKARQLVGVRGAGIAYDGLYYVKSVNHTIKRGEYKQSFTLTRNGLIPLTPRVLP